MLSGCATPEGTSARVAKGRPLQGLTVSSLGLGTYLGNADPATDLQYAAAVKRALELGINVIDSAINYRFQRSERSIGHALRTAHVPRDQILLCTKGGFLSGDSIRPSEEWARDTFVKPGIVSPDDIVAGCHCMTPKYLKHQVDQSRSNLGVETIDVYYVHNPETQLPEVGEGEFYRRLTAAFRTLEESVASGKIRWYGTATWDAFRVPAGHPCHMSLKRTVQCAVEAGGTDHHFKVIQMPFNFSMLEALTAPTQEGATALKAAGDLGLAVFTSVPLVQGQLLGSLPRDLHPKFSGLTTDAQRCLQFVRSTPGLVAPLCGMKRVHHVEENARVLTVEPLSGDDFATFLE